MNIAFIVLDCVRADHVGCYGYPYGTTPNLDAFASSSTRFVDDVSAGVWTLPSMASILTGLYPAQHGMNRPDRPLSAALETVPQLLDRHGYRTAGFSANPHIGRAFGLDRGFQEFHEFWGVAGSSGSVAQLADRSYRRLRPLARSTVKRSQALTRAHMAFQKRRAWGNDQSGSRLAEAAAAWMRDAQRRDRPFFAMLHFMEAHVPYAPPIEHADRFLSASEQSRVRALDHDAMAFLAGANPLSPEDFGLILQLYDATVSYGDELLGRVLDAAGDETLVIVTADHGNHFGDHGLSGHFFSVYEPLSRVPLVVRHPDLPAGVVGRPVQSVDIAATVLEAAGLALLGLPAVSLCASSDPRPYLVSEYLDPDLSRFARFRSFDPAVYRRELRALRQGSFKYIRASDGQEELYDLSNDPAEQLDLAAADPDRIAAFRRMHDEYRSDLTAEPAPLGDRSDLRLDADVATSLRALGYFE